MRRIVLLGFCAIRLAFGQIATSDDGNVVLLSTGWKLDADAEHPDGWSVFRSNDAGRNWTVLASPTDSTDALQPFLTGEASVASWERTGRCFGSCMFALPRSHAEFDGLAAEPRINLYQARLSHNGRFLLTPGSPALFAWELQDLRTGEVWSAVRGGPPLQPVGPPGDDGTILSFATGRLATWKPGMAEPEDLIDAPDYAWAQLSPDGSRAAVWSSTELLVVDTQSRTPASVVRATRSGNVVSFSRDGTRLLFSQGSLNPTLWLWEQGAGRLRQVEVDDPSIGAGTLSGDGRIAWVLTGSGALLRVSLDDADRAQAVFSALPALSQLSFGSVPGSAILFNKPGSRVVHGLRVEASGVTLPVVDENDPNYLAVQIPWDFPATERDGKWVPVTVHSPGNPFQQRIQAYIYGAPQPSFANQSFANGRNYIKVSKGDFSSLVDMQHPAVPGETIHAWLFGLGPLDHDVPTGAPGPSDPPARPVTPFACYLSSPDANQAARGLVLPFLAYAPGLVGVYQVDMTVPQDWPAGDANALCFTGENQIAAYGWIPVGPPGVN